MIRWRTSSGSASRSGAADRLQAAKRLRVRTRRQVTSLFAGHYVSAFRGSGIEYAETRPYVPGDDVRSFDWNATARTGVPHVKQHRPERGRTLVVAIEVSPAMRFATTAKSKLEAACDAAALLAAAAIGVGDRVGLILHDDRRLLELPPHRGELQLHRLLAALATHASRERRAQAFEPPAFAQRADAIDAAGSVDALLEDHRRRGDLVFRFGDARGGNEGEGARAAVSTSTGQSFRARGEFVFVLCSDPGELAWPEAGPARVVPVAGKGSSLVFDGDDELARRRFERAAGQRVARIARRVRARGDDFVHLRTDHDPLRLWLGFFRSRAGARSAR